MQHNRHLKCLHSQHYKIMQPMELLMYILPLLDSMLIQQTVLRNIKKIPSFLWSTTVVNACFLAILIAMCDTWYVFCENQMSRTLESTLSFKCRFQDTLSRHCSLYVRKWQLGLFWGKYIWNSNKLLCYILRQ